MENLFVLLKVKRVLKKQKKRKSQSFSCYWLRNCKQHLQLQLDSIKTFLPIDFDREWMEYVKGVKELHIEIVLYKNGWRNIKLKENLSTKMKNEKKLFW